MFVVNLSKIKAPLARTIPFIDGSSLLTQLTQTLVALSSEAFRSLFVSSEFKISSSSENLSSFSSKITL